jgi:hypothetical protein
MCYKFGLKHYGCAAANSVAALYFLSDFGTVCRNRLMTVGRAVKRLLGNAPLGAPAEVKYATVFVVEPLITL